MEENNIEIKEVRSGNGQKNNQAQIIAGSILIAGIIIAGAILLKGNQPALDTGKTPPVPAENNINTAKIRPIGRDEHILGNPNAKVVIVEYSDTECPFCKMFHSTMHQAIQQKGNDVAWVYRHYPIAQLHPKAFHEAEATECAWEQGGNETFWKYTDELYARTESNNKLDVAELPKIAKDIGLDVPSFNNCLASGKYTAKVQSDLDNGSEIGVNGTPSSFILKNGKVVDTMPGALPIGSVMQKIEQALK